MSGLGGMMGGMGGGMMGGMGGGMGGGMMGGMGGMGGGMGGMGGGMMGGMGGMGGGMGGMGGGMGGMGMGGGFMNVPREILPPQNQGPRFFAVQPETVAIASTAKPAAAKPDSISADPSRPVPRSIRSIWTSRPARTSLRPGTSSSPRHETKRDDAKLRKLSPEEVRAIELRLVRQQQAVLATVQQLKNAAADAFNRNKPAEAAKNQEEIIALIEAALRHDQAQPWMYELLAMSKIAVGRPQAEIDRALMSAREFAQNSAELMYLGAYLVQAKLDRQALESLRRSRRSSLSGPSLTSTA